MKEKKNVGLYFEEDNYLFECNIDLDSIESKITHEQYYDIS
jgi:hypothetical protein